VQGRRALEVAAAGGHHVFFLGPPGCGKTMLAERLPGLLPSLGPTEALEVSAVHSVAGLLTPERPLLTRPPFRAPHHTASVPALVGGGSGVLRPGAVSLAHRGVLFVDEAPEFRTGALDALRQPLESGSVEIARARATARFPARFLLVLAANPCPCARADGGQDLHCSCSPLTRRRYLGRLSGPLLDRIDLRVRLRPVSRAELLGENARGEPTAVVAARVRAARARSAARLAGTPWATVAEVPGPQLRARWSPPRPVMARLLRCTDRGQLSARAVDRVLRVSWTLADLAGLELPGEAEVEEAVELRGALA
jgi:magnesium chelatase family protein